MKKPGAFTLVELLVVVGIILILAAFLFPAIRAQLESARVYEARSEFRILEAALAQYHGRWGDYPSSSPATGDNGGNERLLAALRSAANGGPFLKDSIIARWLGDSDGDGNTEILDPWKNPWVYIHYADYPHGPHGYRINGQHVSIDTVKKGDLFLNLTSYQLWSCGSNRADEAGQGDDIGNVRQ